MARQHTPKQQAAFERGMVLIGVGVGFLALAALIREKEKQQSPKPQSPELGQGPWPGVDVSVQSGIQDYAVLRSQVATDIAAGKVTRRDINAAIPAAEGAMGALQGAIDALWGAAGQLERTQRGRAQGGRSRHRSLVQQMQLLLTLFFQGATDLSGQAISWEDVLTQLPTTSIGPAQFSFGKEAALPVSVPVETEVGTIKLSTPSVLTGGTVSDLANGVTSAANSIRDLAFTWQTRGQGLPQLPSAAILKSLSAQSSLVPSDVFSVGQSYGPHPGYTEPALHPDMPAHQIPRHRPQGRGAPPGQIARVQHHYFGGMKAKHYFDKGYAAEMRVKAARKRGIKGDPRNPYSEGSWQANAWSRGAAAAKGYRPPARGITLDPRILFPEAFGGYETD